jgi:hypothetical protein
MSWDDYLRDGVDRMSADEVQKLDWPDLMRLNLDKLPDVLLTVAMRRFAGVRRWDLAERTLELRAQRGAKADELIDLRNELVGTALRDGDYARARSLAAKHKTEELLLGDHAALELEPGAPFSRLIDFCDEAVRDASGAKAVDLALALLDHAPALGILIARGCLSAEHERDSQLLLQTIEEAGDRLHLPPDDPAWDLWDALADAKLERQLAEAKETGERAQVAEETERLRRALKQASTRVAELEREVRVEKPVAPTVQTDAEAERQLRAKNAELKHLIRESNEERRVLREKLSELSHSFVSDEKSAAEPELDDAEEDLAPASSRGVLLPRIPNRAAESLREHPPRIAADALRTIGELCAGDAAAWSGVKQAKDMPRPLLMCRIGIHYRLLFRADEGVLEVVDLVTRESLDVALKRLRG